jgi:hypothetical protein
MGLKTALSFSRFLRYSIVGTTQYRFVLLFISNEMYSVCRISRSHTGGDDNFYFLGYDTVQYVERQIDVSEEHVDSIYRVEK